MLTIVRHSTLILCAIASLSIHGSENTGQPTNVVFVHGTGAYEGQAHDYHAKRFHTDNRFYQDKRHQNDERYTHQILLPGDHITGPCLPDASDTPEKFGDWTKSHWGQKSDAKKVAAHISPQTDILMGVSRGGPAALRALSLSKNNENLKIICFESPYASVEDCVNHAIYLKSQEKGLTGYAYTAINWLPTPVKLVLFRFGDQKGKGFSLKDRIMNGSPIDYAKAIPATATTLITASLPDKTVPCSSSVKVYNAIKKHNPNTYLLVLNDANANKAYSDGFVESCHANQPNTQEGVAFQDVMQGLRKRHGLMHIPELAATGEGLLSGSNLPSYALQYLALSNMQPTTKELIKAGLYTPSVWGRIKAMLLKKT